MEFKELEKGKISEVEGKILAKWKEENILEKTIENRKDNETWVFYDGPIYANAKPGIHHVFSKTIKDSFCKYQTMKGHKVDRKIGLDCNGLPIEYNVEKKLGINGKKDIEKMGIDKFIEECKTIVAVPDAVEHQLEVAEKYGSNCIVLEKSYDDQKKMQEAGYTYYGQTDDYTVYFRE